MKSFIWFTKHSWSYMKGQRRVFFKNFWSSWREFHKLMKGER